jgi:hypothetical protein
MFARRALIALAAAIVMLVWGMPLVSPISHAQDVATQPAPEEFDPSPYPGGSPFPPGKEPALTHVVHAFWTTVDGIVTIIDVEAGNGRPTQVDILKRAEADESDKGIYATIAPDCDHHVRITPRKLDRQEGVSDVVAEGSGQMEVRVFGWTEDDFRTRPVMVVRYYKGDKLLGETCIEAQPLPKTLPVR